MSRLRSVILAVMMVALLVGLFPMTAGAAPAARQESARVRFIHASFDAPSLDALMDGTAVATGVRGNSEYMDVPAGAHTFSWRVAGEAADRATVSVTLAPGQRATVVAMNTFAALEAKAFIDDVTAPARNRAKIKVIHAVPDAGPINVTMGDMTLATGLAYGSASDASQIPAGFYDIVASGADGTALVTETAKPTNEDRTYTILVVGTVASGSFRLIIYESSVLPPEPTSNFLFGHFAQGVGDLNVHIKQEPAPLYRGVIFSSVQESFTAGLGSYLIELYTPGTDPSNGTPLASGTFEIGAGQSVLFVAQGTVDNLQVGAYVADLSPVPPQSSRLTVVNLAAGNPPFAIERMEGGVLVDSVDVFGTVSTVVANGSINLRFKDAATGAMMMEQGGIQVPNGTVTMLLAFDDDPADPLINALAVSSNQVVQYAAIRWAHLNVFGPPVDIYLDGVPVVTSLVYKMKTDYLLYEPKIYNMTVYQVGSDPATAQPLYQDTIELTGDNYPRTIFVYGEADEAKLAVVADSLELLPPGMARVRFINAAIAVPGVAVYLSTDNSLVIDNVPFGEASYNINVPPGTYVYNFVASFGATGRVEVTVEEGKIYTIVLGGIADEAPGTETFVFVETP